MPCKLAIYQRCHQSSGLDPIHLSEAIGLVLRAAARCKGGEIFVTKMRAANIVDVAETIMVFYNKNIAWDKGSHAKLFPEIGVRPGEKIHEMLVSEHEALTTVEDDNFRIILPMDGSIDEHYVEYNKMKDKEYTSNDYLMKPDQIERMLEEAGVYK